MRLFKEDPVWTPVPRKRPPNQFELYSSLFCGPLIYICVLCRSRRRQPLPRQLPAIHGCTLSLSLGGYLISMQITSATLRLDDIYIYIKPVIRISLLVCMLKSPS